MFLSQNSFLDYDKFYIGYQPTYDDDGDIYMHTPNDQVKVVHSKRCKPTSFGPSLWAGSPSLPIWIVTLPIFTLTWLLFTIELKIQKINAFKPLNY